MKLYKSLFLLPTFLLLAVACSKPPVKPSGQSAPSLPAGQNQKMNSESLKSSQRTEFAELNPKFRFSAVLPKNFMVEYVPEIESINIYNPAAIGKNEREKSQIFIRYFEASRFLTLSTVDILAREETQVLGHEAVKYEIKKKSSVPNFSHQPAWRNNQHKLIDIRFSINSPSFFYVFTYSPELSESEFEAFLQNLIFHNDLQSLKEPISNSSARITKKPFGLKVSPDSSPVSPEKFSGFHTAVDFESLDAELESPVPVFALCGGKLLQKKIADGYGGVAVQECLINGQDVTVIYGHIQLTSLKQSAGKYLVPGEQVALLGKNQSSDTGGERKHLHLGIHKGSKVDWRGYVPNQEELADWLDYQQLIN